MPTKGKVLSNLFLVEKKYEGNCPIINLKNFTKFIPYDHFKMEGLHCLKYILEQDHLVCRIDLKETYFSVLLNKNSQKFFRFQWRSNLYELLCLCFGLRLTPKFFRKLSKVPLALLRRFTIQVIIYLVDMLLMGRTLPEILMAKDTLIFLLQHLGFVINLRKISTSPCETNTVSWPSNRYIQNEFDSFREKIEACVSTMSGDFQANKNFNLKSHKLIVPLSSTVQVILPAHIQF